MSDQMLNFCQSKTHSKKIQWNFNRNTIFNYENNFENVACKMAAIVISENHMWLRDRHF